MKRNTLKEIMEQSISVNGEMPFVMAQDGDRYIIVNLRNARLIDTFMSKQAAIARTYYWNCAHFARKAIAEKDALVIYGALNSDDELMRQAFTEEAIDAICGRL